jgi:glucokinase
MQIVKAIGKLAEDCRNAVGSVDLDAAGIAAPVLMDAATGSVNRAPNLPALDGFRFTEALEKEIGLRVLLENDANSAAIGEHWLGASREIANSICVTLGTGVGGGIILGGKPLRGPDGTAGELGHICVEPNGHPCPCGSWGCVEQYSSATAVVRIAREISERSQGSILSEKPLLTAFDIYEAALRSDPVAIESFRLTGYYLGIALAGLVNVLNPELVVISGGLASAWDMFIEHTRDQITKRAFREPALRVKLVRAKLGDDAGILGVARLAFLATQ